MPAVLAPRGCTLLRRTALGRGRVALLAAADRGLALLRRLDLLRPLHAARTLGRLLLSVARARVLAADANAARRRPATCGGGAAAQILGHALTTLHVDL